MKTISKNRFQEIFNNAMQKKVMVIGDLMIDEYLIGNVSRISPEAPVPVVEINGESLKFGGAANVALNILNLGCYPILVGIIGKDRMGDEFLDLMNTIGMDTSGILRSESRPTTVKTRIIGDAQHIARVDRENNEYLTKKNEDLLLEKIKNLIKQVDAIIFEDYNKGVLSNNIINKTIELAILHNKFISADPKFVNFLEYKNVTFFKPNIKETEAALATKILTDNDLERAGKSLLEKLNCNNVLITQGSKGMTLFSDDGFITNVPTRVRNVADVSGAGDTVISTLSVAMIGGGTNKEAVTLANYAAGLVCEEVGIVPVELEELRKVCLG